jgi:Tfp pilus assembly protein PilO
MTSADLIAGFKKQPVAFVCGALCVVLGALIYLRSDQIEENRVAYEAKAAEATKILANVRNSENLTKQVAEMNTMTADLEGRLVHAGNLAVNLQYFYKLEAENGVKLVDVRQGNPPKPGKSPYVGIPYNVNLQGPFKQVVAFLGKLETGPHFCRFNTVTFSKGGGLVDSPTASGAPITASITLELLGEP